MYDVIIIGGGPAGLTAATYLRRADKTVLVVEKNAFGGQITWSPRVENFPGFVSISGTELGNRLLEQAMEQGAEVELDEVCGVEKLDAAFRVSCVSGERFDGRAVILATGAKPRMLGVENEERFVGSGVSFCAVCDGAFYKGRRVVVCGGGNSALQDAVLLSESCEHVTVLHRRDSFRGEARLVETLRGKENVSFMLNASVKAMLGADELSGLVVEQDGVEKEISADGVFVAVGHEPDNGAFAGLLALDKKGYADSGEDCLTRTPGFFVAGDCRTKAVRQITTAAADGAVAALAACRYLDS